MNNFEGKITDQKEVLVVDDTPASLRLLSDILTAQGYRVRPASRGALALRSVVARLPDLILLDVKMPGMDGYEVCRRLKEEKRSQKVPVIFISALEDTEEKVKGFQAGGVDYITKPFQAQEVLARVKTQLQLSELTERLEQKVRQRTSDLNKSIRAYRALSDCNQVLIRATEENELLQDVCRIICESCQYPMVWVGFYGQNEKNRFDPVAQAGVEESGLAVLRDSWMALQGVEKLTDIAFQTQKAAVKGEILTDSGFIPEGEVARGGFASFAVFPMFLDDEPLGTLNIYGSQPDAFSTDEVELLTELANDLAFGVETLRTRSERQRAEESLRKSEEKYRHLVENLVAEYFFYCHDRDGVFTYLSPSITNVLGYSPKEFMTHYTEYLTDKPINKEVVRHSELSCKGERQPPYELEIYHRDGSPKTLEVSEYPICDDRGKVVSVEGIAHDITARRIAEERIRDSLAQAEAARDKIDAILRSVPHPMIVTDMEGRIVLLNRFAEELAGRPLEKLFHRHVREVILEESFLEHFALSLSGKLAEPLIELVLMDKSSGQMRDYQVRTPVVRNEKGQQTGVVIVLIDVTKDREIARLKNEFISTAAHELNTPLTSVLGYLELLLGNDVEFDSDTQKEFLSTIYSNGSRLARIVDELLQLSRMETGWVPQLKKTQFDLRAIIQKTVDLFSSGEPSHHFEFETLKEPVLVIADVDKVVQVLENIIGNAVKYSPRGSSIQVNCGLGEKGCWVSVQDQGIGMTEEQAKQMFEKFYRVDASNTAVGGLGLGMTISQKIIETHGGKIRVESEKGKGTRVIFELPL